MSDERDSSALPRWEELLRELEQTHRQLESAHADYLEAAAESQRALKRVVDAFGDLSETVRQLVPPPDQRPDREPAEPSDSTPPPEPESGDDAAEPAETPPPREGRQRPASDRENRSSAPEPEAAAEAPGDDRSENTLPAHLHSRGVTIPHQAEAPSEPDEADETDRPEADIEPTPEDQDRQRPGRPPAVPLDTPGLVDAPAPEDGDPFVGIDEEHRIVLTNDGFGVAPRLNEILSEQGLRVRIESRRPEMSSPADTVVFLGSLRAPSDLDDAMDVVDDAIYTADQMTTRLMQPDSSFVVAIDTGGGFGLDDFEPVTAPYGSLLGLIRLLDRRHPGASTKLVDVDGHKLTGDQIAELIAEELLSGGDDSPVGLGHDRRNTVEWSDYRTGAHPAAWLQQQTPPVVYMPGPDAVMAPAVERLAIAHELPVAVLRRRQVPAAIANDLQQMDIAVRSADYDLNRLFEVMDFLDTVRDQFGPIAAVVTESTPAKNPDDLARWDVMRPPLDEFNALLAMTINDPLQMLGVGLGPNTPPVVSSALRYFSRAESLRRTEPLNVRLAHLSRRPRHSGPDLNPWDFALTEYLASAEPTISEVRFGDSNES